MKKLNLVHPENPPFANQEVSVEFELLTDGLSVRFDVRGAPACVNRELSTASSQWGLWEWDVVELFLSLGNGPYYEFQISPLNQFFELEIFEPRKKFNKEFSSGFVHEAVQTDRETWKATMKIPLKALGWDGKRQSLRGNAFAILGEPKARSYWSLFLPKQTIPDFHLPQYFAPLF